MGVIAAGKLRTGQKFLTLITRLRGFVEDMRQIVAGHTNDKPRKPIYINAPRVMLVGGEGGVRHKTMHPDVQVEAL